MHVDASEDVYQAFNHSYINYHCTLVSILTSETVNDSVCLTHPLLLVFQLVVTVCCSGS